MGTGGIAFNGEHTCDGNGWEELGNAFLRLNQSQPPYKVLTDRSLRLYPLHHVSTTYPPKILPFRYFFKEINLSLRLRPSIISVALLAPSR